MTTRGRRSGLPREIEIWFTQLGDRFYVMAEYPTSHWVQNLRAHPEVKVRVAGHEFPGTARIVEDSETELVRHVKALSQEKYGWSDGLIVELLPSYPSALS